MSDARNAIFDALEAAILPNAPRIRRTATSSPLATDDAETRQTLALRLGENGGQFVSAQASDWRARLSSVFDLASLEHVYYDETLSRMPGDGGSKDDTPGSHGVGRSARMLPELAGLEACVLRAEFAVVENGAAWHVPSSPLERAAALLCESLVLVVAANALVPTMHQAYERIVLGETGFGWFLCGPSKTADIEQSLVLGAHGPRRMALVVIGDA